MQYLHVSLRSNIRMITSFPNFILGPVSPLPKNTKSVKNWRWSATLFYMKLGESWSSSSVSSSTSRIKSKGLMKQIDATDHCFRGRPTLICFLIECLYELSVWYPSGRNVGATYLYLYVSNLHRKRLLCGKYPCFSSDVIKCTWESFFVFS